MADCPDWLVTIAPLFAAVRAAGGELRAVGGAVRDWHMGTPSADVDLATTLLPEQVMAMAVQHGWKAVPTGIDHGTVTVVLDHKPYEITTLRRDVETDGRHAKVAYTDNWVEDAARRDFTVNALYMDAEGATHDPTGQGRKDLKDKTLRFIGDANTRIEEDALRILRYYRFLAQLEWSPNPDALAACERHAKKIETLSGERIAQEMKKLLSTYQPVVAARAIQQAGIDRYVAGQAWHSDHLERLVAAETAHIGQPNPWARLIALGADVQFVTERWKPSRDEQKQLRYLADPWRGDMLAPWVKAGLENYPRPWVQAKILLHNGDAALVALAGQWQVPEFPIKARDLIARGFEPGKALGEALGALHERWVSSDYALTKEQLLQ